MRVKNKKEFVLNEEEMTQIRSILGYCEELDYYKGWVEDYEEVFERLSKTAKKLLEEWEE